VEAALIADLLYAKECGAKKLACRRELEVQTELVRTKANPFSKCPPEPAVAYIETPGQLLQVNVVGIRIA
jgi:hypothetical protein